jgi:hypothetical protein
MKNIFRIFRVFALVAFLAIITGNRVQSQPEPPAPPDKHGLSGDPVATGAPLENGPGLLILFGLIYAGSSLYQTRKMKNSLDEK